MLVRAVGRVNVSNGPREGVIQARAMGRGNIKKGCRER